MTFIRQKNLSKNSKMTALTSHSLVALRKFQIGSHPPEPGFTSLSGQFVRTSAQIPRDTYLMLRNLDKNGRTRGLKSWLQGKNGRLHNGKYRVYTKKFDQIINGRSLKLSDESKSQMSNLRTTELSDTNKIENLKQRLASQQDRLAVSLLVDCSGSMEERAQAVVKTCIIIDGLMKSQEIPFEVLGFNVIHGDAEAQFSELSEIKQKQMLGRVGDLRHYVFKSFDEAFEEESFTSIFQAIENGVGNIDGEALVWAHSRLRSRREEIRYLLVLTDGNPGAEQEGSGSAWTANNKSGYISAHLKNITNQLSRQEIIVIGVGIGTEVDISRFYKNYISIPSGDNIDSEVLNVIELVC